MKFSNLTIVGHYRGFTVSTIGDFYYLRGELMLKLKPLIAAKAKENLTLSPGRGKKGPQNSANLIETRKELSKLAGVSHNE